jgi:hypothetical protein
MRERWKGAMRLARTVQPRRSPREPPPAPEWIRAQLRALRIGHCRVTVRVSGRVADLYGVESLEWEDEYFHFPKGQSHCA